MMPRLLTLAAAAALLTASPAAAFHDSNLEPPIKQALINMLDRLTQFGNMLGQAQQLCARGDRNACQIEQQGKAQVRQLDQMMNSGGMAGMPGGQPMPGGHAPGGPVMGGYGAGGPGMGHSGGMPGGGWGGAQPGYPGQGMGQGTGQSGGMPGGYGQGGGMPGGYGAAPVPTPGGSWNSPPPPGVNGGPQGGPPPLPQQ